MRDLDASVSLTEGDVRLRVTGLSKTVRALERAGVDATDMKDLMHSIGEMIAGYARPNTPRGTSNTAGRLASSIRAGRGKTKAVVRAGTASIPYAGVIHYGWPAHNITAQPFLTDALTAHQSEAIADLIDGLGEILDRLNLENTL